MAQSVWGSRVRGREDGWRRWLDQLVRFGNSAHQDRDGDRGGNRAFLPHPSP